jgi:tetratricopeptide (TPR) repeat protein
MGKMNIQRKASNITVFTAFLVVGSILLAGCTNSEQALVKYSELIRDADKLYEQYEYSEAVKKYSEAADLVPTESDAFFGLVGILEDKGKLGQAAEIVEKSAGKISAADRSKLYAIIGNGYLERNDLNNAQKYYIEANKGVDNIPAKVGLAQVYMKKGELDKVGGNLEVTDVKDTNYAKAALLRAYLKLDDTKGAKEELSELTSTDLDEDTKAQYDSFLAAINSATDDKLYTATLLSGEYINAGYPYLAIKLLEPMKDEMVEYADGLYFLGRAYFDHGKYGSAIDVLNEALSFDVYTAEVYSLLAKAYYINGDQEKAFENFEKAYTFASDKEKEKYLLTYVDLLLEQEQQSKAQTYLAKGDEDSYRINIRFVQLQYIKRDFEKMEFYLEKVAKMNMTDDQMKEYLYWLITFEIENDKATSARENLSELRDLDRFNPEYYLLLGKLELAENNTDEGREALETALEYDLSGEVTDAAKKLLARID